MVKNVQSAGRTAAVSSITAASKAPAALPMAELSGLPDSDDGALTAAKDRLHACHAQHAFVLTPMLDALFLLANSQRVLNDLDAGAAIDEALQERLSNACPTWRDPIVDGYGVLTELARSAHDLAVGIGNEIDQIWLQLPRGGRP